MPMPYRETDETADFRAYTQTLKRDTKGDSAVIVSCVLLLFGFLLVPRGHYSPVGFLPMGFHVMLTCGVKLRRLWRLRFTAPTKVIDAHDGIIAVRGRVVASEQGLFVAPVSGQLAVWAHVEANAEGRGADSPWITVLDATAARDFAIDDGSGELAYVEIGHVQMIRSSLAATVTAETTPRLRCFFRVNPPVPGAICAIDSTRPARLVLRGGDTPLVVSRFPPPSPWWLICGLVLSVLVMGLALLPFVFSAGR